jgi:SAM-dependent methyltransferase
VFLFVLGRQPEFGLSELRAVVDRRICLAAPEIAVLEFEKSSPTDFKNSAAQNSHAKFDFDRLGSIVKAARVVKILPDLSDENLSNLARQIFAGASGKITLGISTYHLPKSSAAQIAAKLKQILIQTNSVRIVSGRGDNLNAATVWHNHLAGGNPKKRELILAKTRYGILAALTTNVQNLNAYAARDEARPRRDARVGMLPPKLAQTMINLARAVSQNLPPRPTLLDPFCGSGVILQEAALAGYDVLGSDISPRMIDFTRENLAWLRRKFKIDFGENLAVGDAADFQWNNFNLIDSETYLGQPFATQPTQTQIEQNLKTCNQIIAGFLKNLRPQISPGVGICLAVPAWRTHGRTYHLPLTKNLTNLGYRRFDPLTFEPAKPDAKNLLYRRENQIVGRELLLLRKKS